MGPEPVVCFFVGGGDLFLSIEQTTRDLLHVLVRTDKNEMRRIIVTMNTKRIVSFQEWYGDSRVILSAPIKQLAIANRLTLCSVALVFRINSLSEVLGVREIQGDIGGVVL